MHTAYVVKAYINQDGTIVLDEPVALSPGPVLLTVLPMEQPSSALPDYTDEQHAELWRRIDEIAALTGPPPPDDGLSARDAETILYGPQHGSSNVG